MNSVIETLKNGGVTLGVICLLSLTALFVLMERLLSSYGIAQRARGMTDHVIKLLYQGELEQARVFCQQNGQPPAPLFAAALTRAVQGRPGVEQVLERERANFNQTLRRRLWILGTIGAAAPFVGLFGTVLGIMSSFKDIGETGGGGFAVVSRGLSEALVTTAAGIFVAVEAVVFYNFLQARVASLAFLVRQSCEELLEVLHERPRKLDDPTPLRQAGT